MIDWLNQAWLGLLATRPLELAAVAFGVAYVVLATRQIVWCWPAGIISTALYVIVYQQVSLDSQALLNVYYVSIAIYGWYQWLRGGEQQDELAVNRLSGSHYLLLSVIAAAAIVPLGYFTSARGANLPYLDAATACFSVLATWMIARKVLHGWLYWIAINPVVAWMNHASGLQSAALLHLVYTGLAVYGYRQWQRSSLNPNPQPSL